MAIATPVRERDERQDQDRRVAYDLRVQRFLQPDDATCGPTCLRKVYDFFGHEVELEHVIAGLDQHEEGGGTLAVFLGLSALRSGFNARLYPYDLRIFDPSWFSLAGDELAAKIRERFPYLRDPKRLRAARAYVEFLQQGGEIVFEELTHTLFKRIIDREHPVLAGLSATYLYRYARERWDAANGRLVDDDVGGDPIGHFVVISGYDQWGRQLTVLDPFAHVPASEDGRVVVDSDRLINAILLGDMTYDAVLLEVWPDGKEKG